VVTPVNRHSNPAIRSDPGPDPASLQIYDISRALLGAAPHCPGVGPPFAAVLTRFAPAFAPVISCFVPPFAPVLARVASPFSPVLTPFAPSFAPFVPPFAAIFPALCAGCCCLGS
jgi:hypothetical protein